MSKVVYPLEKVARVIDRKGNEREIVSLIKNDAGAVSKVIYRVTRHKEERRVGTVSEITKKAFVDWFHGVQIEKDQFKRGDIIRFEDMTFIVLRNNGIHGIVKDTESNIILKKFYWRGCSNDLRCHKIGETKEV